MTEVLAEDVLDAVPSVDAGADATGAGEGAGAGAVDESMAEEVARWLDVFAEAEDCMAAGGPSVTADDLSMGAELGRLCRGVMSGKWFAEAACHL